MSNAEKQAKGAKEVGRRIVTTCVIVCADIPSAVMTTSHLVSAAASLSTYLYAQIWMSLLNAIKFHRV